MQVQTDIYRVQCLKMLNYSIKGHMKILRFSFFTFLEKDVDINIILFQSVFFFLKTISDYMTTLSSVYLMMCACNVAFIFNSQTSSIKNLFVLKISAMSGLMIKVNV